MIDRILDFIIHIWDNLIPFIVVCQYEEGILLRLGKFKKVVAPGLVWKIPFVDTVEVHTVVVTTLNLSTQSLITKDEKNIIIRGVVKYKISDIKIFMLDVFDAVDAISDMTMAIIKHIIMENDWQKVKENDLDAMITKKARIEAKKWGIEIIQVTLSDIGQIRTYRLINDHPHH